MKSKIYSLLLFFGLIGAGCSDFTEIDPKGKNTLNRMEDLDLVLNYTYSLSVSEVCYFVNDEFPGFTNIPTLINQNIKTLEYAYFTWDESVDRVTLTESDYKYTRLYEIIGQVANPVLLNVDVASGDRVLADRLKAEALVLRAWCHYLLVNFYAKAYNPATAETDPGIVYALETDDMAAPNEKLTVAKVYEMILADLNAALDLGSLPVVPNKMRVGLSFAYAVKAKVLMSIRDYDGAFAAAEESLKLNNSIDNYYDLIAPETMLGTGMLEFTRPYFTCEEELFETPSMYLSVAFTPEMWNAFEEGHIIPDYILTDESILGYPAEGNMYYGLDVPVLYSFNVYYSPFGLTTVDMYLVQAECYIREGNLTDAMDLLNRIREKRISVDKYVEKTAATSTEAFAYLKQVSRTENFATPKNYINLKRWNTETAYQETLRRVIEYTENTYDESGSVIDSKECVREYILAPDSPLWIFPFPQNATLHNPNLTQNYE
ncbi:RagB/SusD family nutrient uptake outer membrane protein [Butyricimonas faecihominis]|uniref:RagB/SusD family nutrient uptake outer membrane protein n=1 Tax=Butyricimonas faecihominis TaxID=1472416 RepID=UPI0032C0E7F4